MSLLKRAATVSSWTALSRVLGMVRDSLWAASFGASLILDCFLAAFQLPNLVRNLFGEGALSAAVVPRYVRAREEDPAAAERFAGVVLTRLAIGLGLAAILAMALAAGVVAWGSGRAVVIAALALPMLPYLAFICVAAVASGILNGRRHFWVPAATPVVLNLALISTVMLAPDQEVWVLPYAVLASGIAAVALHLWALRRTGGVPPLQIAPDPAIAARSADLRKAFLPTVASSGVHQIGTYAESLVALLLVPGNGAVAVLYFANRLLQFPLALIGHAVTTAAYPELASRAGQGWAALGDGLREGGRLLWFWLLPAAVGLCAVADPLIRAIYQYGSFGEDQVDRTVLALRLYALALVPIATQKLWTRAFHAAGDTATPLRAALVLVAINVAAGAALALTPLREAGIALASCVSYSLGCLWYARRLHALGTGAMLRLTEIARPLLAALAMGAVVAAILAWWPHPDGARGHHGLARLATAVIAGAGIYLGIAGTAWLRKRVV